MIYRQGDILFTRTAKPGVAKTKNTEVKDGVIALGEVTGHSHRLAPGSAATLFRDKGDNMAITVEEEADVIHEEHDTVKLPEGTYKVTRQREYQPEGNKQVID